MRDFDRRHLRRMAERDARAAYKRLLEQADKVMVHFDAFKDALLNISLFWGAGIPNTGPKIVKEFYWTLKYCLTGVVLWNVVFEFDMPHYLMGMIIVSLALTAGAYEEQAWRFRKKGKIGSFSVLGFQAIAIAIVATAHQPIEMVTVATPDGALMLYNSLLIFFVAELLCVALKTQYQERKKLRETGQQSVAVWDHLVTALSIAQVMFIATLIGTGFYYAFYEMPHPAWVTLIIKYAYVPLLIGSGHKLWLMFRAWWTGASQDVEPVSPWLMGVNALVIVLWFVLLYNTEYELSFNISLISVTTSVVSLILYWRITSR